MLKNANTTGIHEAGSQFSLLRTWFNYRLFNYRTCLKRYESKGWQIICYQWLTKYQKHNPIKKWTEYLNRCFSKEYIQAHEKILNVVNY